MNVSVSGSGLMIYRHPDRTIGWWQRLENGVTNEGLSWLLNTGLTGLPQVAAERVGLINGAGFTAVDDTNDTHASHSGWNEFTALLSASRPTWTPLPANGGLLGTSLAATFDITADGTLKGFFLTTVAAVGSVAAGVLYNTAVARSALAVSAGGTVTVAPAVRLRN